jgi:hypothetical protein
MSEETLKQASVPEGYEDFSGDIEAFWEPYSEATRKRDAVPGSPPMLFTPLHLTLMDSSIEKNKSTTLIHGRLEAPCELRVAGTGKDGDDPEYQVFPVGTLIGIWAKPAMRQIRKLGGVKVYLANTGETKDVGKPSPMVTFTIKAPKGAKGEPLKVLEDRRKESLPEDIKRKRALAAEQREKESYEFDMDDVPF